MILFCSSDMLRLQAEMKMSTFFGLRRVEKEM